MIPSKKIADAEAARRFAAHVERILGDDEVAQEQATMALSRMGPGITAAVVELLEDPEVLERRRAVMALVSVLADFIDPRSSRAVVEDIVDCLGRLLLAVEDNGAFALWHAADGLVEVLGRSPADVLVRDEDMARRVLAHLAKALDASHPAGRMVALYAVVASGSLEFLERVRHMGGHDEDGACRGMAARAALCLERGERDIDLACLAIG